MEFVIDTNVFLNVKNREKPYFEYSKSILDSVDDGRNKAFISTVVIAEICSGYYLTREIQEKEEFLLHLLSSQNYKVVDVSVTVADEAARIRSETGLKLPDAIIVATGTTAKAKYVVTNDTDSFKKASKTIGIRTPKEFITETDSRRPPEPRKNIQHPEAENEQAA
jgi:predicted nucleic acid-binding protein